MRLTNKERGLKMIKDALMRDLNNQYQKHFRSKPIKENRFDMFYDNRIKRWEQKEFKLHNLICDRAITLLNK